MARRMVIAGNWKMNGTSDSLAVLNAICEGVKEPVGELEGKIEVAPEPEEAMASPEASILVCPPYTLLGRFVERASMTKVLIGGQDCHPEEAGAHTGDVSAPMLADIGCEAVIVGHSERRADHGEDDTLVKAKAGAVLAAGMAVILCIGETEAERDSGEAEAVVTRQLAASLPDGADGDRLIVAYEPVWAIGTGRTPTLPQIDAMHGALRAALREHLGQEDGDGVRLLYGGSMKPDNAAEILALAEVDGGLIGGASLQAESFLAIVDAAEAVRTGGA